MMISLSYLAQAVVLLFIYVLAYWTVEANADITELMLDRCSANSFTSYVIVVYV